MALTTEQRAAFRCLTPDDVAIRSRVRLRLYPETQLGVTKLRAHLLGRAWEAERQDQAQTIQMEVDWMGGRRHVAEVLRRQISPLERTLMAVWPSPRKGQCPLAWRRLRMVLEAMAALYGHQGVTHGDSVTQEDVAWLGKIALQAQILTIAAGPGVTQIAA